MQNSISSLAKPGVLACVLAASLFAACGGDDDDSTGGTSHGGQGQGGESTAQAGQSTNQAGSGNSTASVARGDYLVNHVAACGDCHTPRGPMGAPVAGMFLAGNAAFADLNPLDDKKGLLPTPNLTPDKTTGLGDWTDAEIKNAFQNGLDKDNKPLLSVMPYYVFHNMTDSDADSIVMYLRSIPAVNNAIPERQDLGFPVTQAKPVPVAKIPDTTLKTTDPKYASAQNGRYLAGFVGVCMECHSEHDPTAEVPLLTDKLFQGNESYLRAQLGLPDFFPEKIYSANITPDKTGIAGWTPADVVKVLHEGVDKEGRPLCPPMPVGPKGAFGGLTDTDALDIGTFLTTLAPQNNGVIPQCMVSMPGAGGAGGAGAGGMSSGGAGAGSVP